MSTKTKINIREVDQTFARPAGDVHQFEFVALQVKIIELEDLHFHFDSHILLADFDSETPTPDMTVQPRITALAILAECLREAERNNTELVLIAGHTDTSGDANYNIGLSQRRADNVLFALTGDREKWIQSCLDQQKNHPKGAVEDYQLILKWVARDRGFDCDPGPIDNVKSPSTTEATRKFQVQFNIEFSRSIEEDGKVGRDTWGAFFDVYTEEIKEILEVDDAGLAAKRANIKFVDGGKKTVGCGENFPIEERGNPNFRSRINRRVEILFFTPPELPVLKCHPSRNSCLKNRCEVNRPRIFKPTVIPVPPVQPRVVRRLNLDRLEFHPVRPVPTGKAAPNRSPAPTGSEQATTNEAGVAVASLTATSPLNIIPNPPVIPILTAAEATEQTAARIEFTFFRPKALNFTDDDPRLTWTFTALAGGDVRFVDRASGKKGNTGLKVFVFGVTAGEVRLDVSFKGSVVASYRALVLAIKRIPSRFNILNGPDAASTPSSTPANIKSHVAITNLFLRQMAIELAFDTDLSVTNGAVAVAGSPGIFTIAVAAADTVGLAASGQPKATVLNFRPNVANFAYVRSGSGGELGAATDRLGSRAGLSIDDVGTPSNSWDPPSGIPPDGAAKKVTMALRPERERSGQTQLFAMYMTDANGNPSTNALTFANTLAHEFGHILNMGHRGVKTNPVFDGLEHPPNENVMHPTNPPGLAQDFDIVQARAAHQSKLVSP